MFDIFKTVLSSLKRDIDAYFKCTSDSEKAELQSIIANKCAKNTKNVQQYIRSIKKRLGQYDICRHQTTSADKAISMDAINLLDNLVRRNSMCRAEIATLEFEKDFRLIMRRTHPQVSMRMRFCLKQWADDELKHDEYYRMSEIQQFYERLKEDGLGVDHLFPTSSVDSSESTASTLTITSTINDAIHGQNVQPHLVVSLPTPQVNNNESQASESVSTFRNETQIFRSPSPIMFDVDLNQRDREHHTPRPASPVSQDEQDDIARAIEYLLENTNIVTLMNNNQTQTETSASISRNETQAPRPPSPISQREQNDIARAIDLSLGNTNHAGTPSRTPSTSTSGAIPRTSNYSHDVNHRSSTEQSVNPLTDLTSKKELTVNCNICLEYKENADVVATRCGHLFHKDCLYQWLQQSNTCPDCRVQTTIPSLTKLFGLSVTSAENHSIEIENLTTATKQMNLSKKRNQKTVRNRQQANTNAVEQNLPSTSAVNTRIFSNTSNNASGNSRRRNRGNRSNRGTRTSAVNFDRMIWLGSSDNSLTKEALSTIIREKFNVAFNQFVIENMFSERNRLQKPSISFKISVDSEDTFNRLMNASTWRPYRVREFIVRP